jgi:TRAP-type transport system periplasmic protein
MRSETVSVKLRPTSRRPAVGRAGRSVWIALPLGLLLAGLPACSAPAPDVTTLRLSSYTSPRGIEGEMIDWFADQLGERSGGRLSVERYFGGSLLKARETLRGVESGAVDLGFIFVPYYPRALPAWTVAEPFLLGPVDPERRSDFFWELYAESPELEAALDRWNQRLVAIHVFGRHSVGGPRALTSLADLRGIRVRCAGGYDALHMSSLGANVVFLSGSELYSAMQKGAVDASYTPVTSYFRYRLAEIGKDPHLLVIPQFVGSVALITMNKDSFNRLSPEQQSLVIDAGREYSRVESARLVELEEANARALTEAGTTVVYLPEDEVRRWARDAEPVSRAKWLEATRGRGGGEALLERAEALLARYGN